MFVLHHLPRLTPAGSIALALFLSLSILIGASGCSSGYYDTFKKVSEQRLLEVHDTSLVTEKDIAHLPLPVQRYLHFTGTVGKPKVHNLRVRFAGAMKRSVTADWMDIDAQQYEFFGDNARLFYISSSLFGIPFDGLHSYTGDSATMKITIAGLIQIADARGDTMTRSETVTLFNDMCLMAPSTLISESIRWEAIDSFSVRAYFSNKQYTIAADLFFDSTSALVNFSSMDRYLSEDGTIYTNYRWSTPVSGYTKISGRLVPTFGEAIWHMPEGDFPYARFTTLEIEYNCTTFR
uniref:Uncharacterized protein n=1 Tax=uncultured bacterium pAM1 TaxID=1781153 RepID=A0A1C9U4Z2_9BACT|nr:hypothetical protein [uncultured bacterium pAM1]